MYFSVLRNITISKTAENVLLTMKTARNIVQRFQKSAGRHADGRKYIPGFTLRRNRFSASHGVRDLVLVRRFGIFAPGKRADAPRYFSRGKKAPDESAVGDLWATRELTTFARPVTRGSRQTGKS